MMTDFWRRTTKAMERTMELGTKIQKFLQG